MFRMQRAKMDDAALSSLTGSPRAEFRRSFHHSLSPSRLARLPISPCQRRPEGINSRTLRLAGSEKTQTGTLRRYPQVPLGPRAVRKLPGTLDRAFNGSQGGRHQGGPCTGAASRRPPWAAAPFRVPAHAVRRDRDHWRRRGACAAAPSFCGFGGLARWLPDAVHSAVLTATPPPGVSNYVDSWDFG